MALSDFDDDYDDDDTPPASPIMKAKLQQQKRTPAWRKFRRTVYHFRGLILATIVTFIAIQYIRTRKKPFFTPKHAPALKYKNVNWKHYAYSQYATDSHHICNSLMVFDQLDRLGAKAEKILMYPEDMDLIISNDRDRDSQLLVKARKEYGVKLVPIAVEGMRIDPGGGTYRSRGVTGEANARDRSERH